MLNSDQAGLGVVPLTKSARVFQSIKIYSIIDLRYVKKSQHFSKSLDQWLCREDSVQKKTSDLGRGPNHPSFLAAHVFPPEEKQFTKLWVEVFAL